MLASTRQPLTNRHSFFLNSFDPGGFVPVDQPPLGLWVQAASAARFGLENENSVKAGFRATIRPAVPAATCVCP